MKNNDSLCRKIKDILFYAGVGQNNYMMAQPAIIKVNKTMIRVISGITTVLALGMFLSSFFVDGVTVNRPVYATGMVAIGVIFIASLTLTNDDRYKNKAVMALVYLCYSVFCIYGILIGIITDPDEKAVTFMVMLVFLPAIFVDCPSRVIVVLMSYVAIFIWMCYHSAKPSMALDNDVLDAVFFGILGIATSISSNCIKIKGYSIQQELKDVSRIDSLTGMQNRNAYEMDFYKVSKYCELSLGCIYIDANGLKHLNDNRGHEAGDKMLQIVAKSIIKYFGEGLSYRIGGDEFVAFVIDPGYFEIKTKADNFLSEIQKRGYYASIGWQIHDIERISMKELVKEAENFMYQKKVEFYKQADFDRRID